MWSTKLPVLARTGSTLGIVASKVAIKIQRKECFQVVHDDSVSTGAMIVAYTFGTLDKVHRWLRLATARNELEHGFAYVKT